MLMLMWNQSVGGPQEKQMTTRQNATADAQAAIEALRTELAAALADKASLAKQLALRNSGYSERMEHESAIVDVLKAMSASPGSALPVFDLITCRAQELC